MNRAESALATAKRLADMVGREKRVSRLLNAVDCAAVPARTPHEWPESHFGAYLAANRAQRRGDGPGWDVVDAAEVAMHECPVCAEKWRALELRRSLRRRRGALRAALVRIGKLALEEERTTP